MTTWTLWGTSGGNNNADNADPVNLGTKTLVKSGEGVTRAWVIGAAYFRGTASGGTKTARIYRTSDQVLLSGVATFTDSGIGWQYAYFATALEVALDFTFTTSVLFPVGAPSYTTSYFTAGGPGVSGITNGPLYAPNSSDALGQGVFAGGSTAVCPTNSFNANNYWVTPIITDVNPNLIVLNGIAPTGGVGQPALVPGAHIITPNGIAPVGGVGSPSLAPGDWVIEPEGIAPTGGVGSPTLAGRYTISLAGIAPTGGAGTPTLVPGAVAIQPNGIPPVGGVGSPALHPRNTLVLTGIAPTGGVGTPAVVPGAVAIRPTGIAPTGGVGRPRLGRPPTTSRYAVGAPSTRWQVGPPQTG